MDFSLTTDIESDFLRWEEENDDENNKDTTNHNESDDNANEKPGNDPNNYFDTAAFSDQSLSNQVTQTLPAPTSSTPAPTHTPAINNSSLNTAPSIGGSASVPVEGLQRFPQHLSHQQNLLEPILPPSYFLQGGIHAPWDPSTQAVPNVNGPQITMKSSSVPDQKPAEQNNMKSVNQSQLTATTLRQEEWGASQISRQIALHQQANKTRDLAAAAARAMLPEQSSLHLQESQPHTITDASVNTGSSSSSQPSSSINGKTKASSSISQLSNNQLDPSLQAQHNSADPPPFYLFDAPCELRANFQQAQRQNEMTNFQDSNSFHYGMAVNGFHPQVNAQVNPIMPASLGAAVLPNGKKVELIDGRHKYKRKSTERNEREQQRAQKITELIDKLRNTMEEGGWRVEMKSKYQILSHSTDYLKHLISTTKEKERNLQKTKTELAIRTQKLEEENNIQGSDPESVTSSLTAASCSESKVRGSRGSTEDSSTNVAVASSITGKGVKRKGLSQDNPEETQEGSKKCQRTLEKNDDDSNQSSGNMDSNKSGSGHNGKNISIGKMSSSLSDITDSNRGSSDGQGSKGTGSSDGQGNSGKEMKTSFDLSLLAPNKSDTKVDSTSSISSTAAVVSGVGEKKYDHRDTNIIFTRDRKRKHREKTSLDEGFELSYQEVFLSSNVPQLIATPAGRIVACNDFFFRVTGLTQKDVKRFTIFSMVQVDKLSTLFDLVADSLRKSNILESLAPSSQTVGIVPSNSDGLDKRADKGVDPGLNFQTVTLPCVPFPQELTSLENVHEKKKLFMNVTFMYDSNPLKRYIHCALTDKPDIGGKIGAITPQLLSMLFPPQCSVKR